MCVESNNILKIVIMEVIESDTVVRNNVDSCVNFTQFPPMVTFCRPKV